MRSHSYQVPLERTAVSTYTVPTDLPESDGTLEWDNTTLVLVQATAASKIGVGYTYADSVYRDANSGSPGEVADWDGCDDPGIGLYVRCGEESVTSDDRESARWPFQRWIARCGI